MVKLGSLFDHTGPNEVLAITSSNAEVKALNQPNAKTIFVALNRLRPCYPEMENNVWLGHGTSVQEAAKSKQKAKQKVISSPYSSTTYSGSLMRSRAQAMKNAST